MMKLWRSLNVSGGSVWIVSFNFNLVSYPASRYHGSPTIKPVSHHSPSDAPTKIWMEMCNDEDKVCRSIPLQTLV